MAFDALPSKHVTFTADSPRISVRAKPGDGAPVVTDGYGNVETITRPQRKGLTRWTGSNPMAISIPILLDGFRSGRSVEPQIAALERMAGVGGEQPGIKITSTGNLVPHQDEHRWLITGLDFGEAILTPGGQRVRQAIVVTVVAQVLAATEKSVSKRNSSGGSHARSYRVKAGDTLLAISRKVFGTPDRWAAIRSLNGISDPRIVGKPGKKKGATGTTLQMPK